MRRFLVLVGAFVASWALPGCQSSCGVAAMQPVAAPVAAAPCAVGAPVQYVQAAAPCAGVQTVQVVGAPQVAANGVQYVQVQYRVGAQEWARAGLAIPGNLIVCVGNFVRCATEALFPIPQPSAQLVAAPAPQYVQVVQAPAAAAPCAPAGVPAPSAPPPAGRWVWTPGTPPPEPTSMIPAAPCVEVVECCVAGDPRCDPGVPPDLAYASK